MWLVCFFVVFFAVNIWLIVFLFNNYTFSYFRYDRLTYLFVRFIFRNIWLFFYLSWSLFTFYRVWSRRSRYIHKHFIVSKVYTYLRSKIPRWNWRVAIKICLFMDTTVILMIGKIIRIILIVLRRNIIVIVMNDNLRFIPILIKVWLSSYVFCLRI